MEKNSFMMDKGTGAVNILAQHSKKAKEGTGK